MTRTNKKMFRLSFLLLPLFWLATANAENTESACSRWYEVPASKLTVSCPAGHTVHISKAIYGFWKDQSQSDNCHYVEDDCTVDAMRVAVSQCHGKTLCEIPVGTSIVTHALGAVLGLEKKCGAWHDRHDYMEVTYDCRPVPAGAKIVASDCTQLHTINQAPHEKLEGVMRPLQHELTLRCPQHQTIRVVEAFYGWWKDNRDQGCRFHAEDCKETSDAAAFCNGLTECEVPIERSSTSDTCGGFHLFSLQVDHHDYFQVDYQCLTEK